ncbi:LPXTG cell wall anchor domain-containing protein [Gracilibacillus sp. JCM 18860]|uniref:LPXTG cell wall anchor domain-containing protein n=1 Tax=Gracilibacillus sp. JCM 18860 TaxID=1306159 RepID=UPI000A966BCC
MDYTIVKNGTSIEGTSGQSTPAPPEKDTEKEPEPKPDPEDSNDETEKEEDVPEGIDDEDKHLERNNEENEKNEKTEDSEAPNKETQTKEQTTDFIEEQRLPDTATQQYNFLLGGIILLVLGIGLFIWRRKKII